MKWKAVGEEAVSGHCEDRPGWEEDWQSDVHEAVEICLPGFVPIVATVQGNHPAFWQESLSLLSELAVLESRMRGGTVDVFKIGEAMLYVAGALGMALAVRTKETSFIED